MQQIKTTIPWIAWAVIAFVAFLIRGADVRLEIITGLILCLSVLIHINGHKKDSSYAWKMFGVRTDAGRDTAYDILRAMAAVFVIVTHVIQVDLSETLVTLSDSGIYAARVIYILTMSCNVIYVMISGALLIPYKEENAGIFYLRRIEKVAVPMIVYYIFYFWFNHQFDILSAPVIKGIAVNLWTGNTTETPHFWLIYTILSLYIVIPFLRYLCRNMPYRVLTLAVMISWLFMFLGLLGMYSPGLATFLSSWTGVALTGYWVTRKESRQYDGVMVAAGVTAALCAGVIVKTQKDFMIICCNCSPVMVIFCIGIFAAVFHFRGWTGRKHRFLCALSRYSYPIILLHWWAIHYVVKEKIAYLSFPVYGFRVATETIFVLTVCWITAFFIDNLVLPVPEAVFDVIIRGWKKEKGEKNHG